MSVLNAGRNTSSFLHFITALVTWKIRKFALDFLIKSGTLCASSLDGKSSQPEGRSAQKSVDHRAEAMSRDLGGKTGHQTPRAFGVVFGQVQLLLQLGIDRFTDQTQAVELLLSQRRAFWSLVGFGRGQQLQLTMLPEVTLQSGIIVSPIPKQALQVMGKGVEQFDHRLVVVAAGRSEQEASLSMPFETPHRMRQTPRLLPFH